MIAIWLFVWLVVIAQLQLSEASVEGCQEENFNSDSQYELPSITTYGEIESFENELHHEIRFEPEWVEKR